MFANHIVFHVKPEHFTAAAKLWQEQILTRAQHTVGYMGAILFKDHQHYTLIGMTLWETQKDAQDWHTPDNLHKIYTVFTSLLVREPHPEEFEVSYLEYLAASRFEHPYSEQ